MHFLKHLQELHKEHHRLMICSLLGSFCDLREFDFKISQVLSLSSPVVVPVNMSRKVFFNE